MKKQPSEDQARRFVETARSLGADEARAPEGAFNQRAADERDARALIKADPKIWHGRAIAEEFGWPLDDAAAFVTRTREKIDAEARQDAAE